MPWTPETAKEAQKKSAEVRRRRKLLTPAERVRDIAAADADAAIRDLIKGAKGQGEYETLSPKERLDMWKTVLAYGVGRPTSSKVTQAEDNDEDGEPEEPPSLV